MTPIERLECGLLATAALGTWMLGDALPTSIPIGELLAVGGVSMLLQSLGRNWLRGSSLRSLKRFAATAAGDETLPILSFSTAVGILLILLAGATLWVASPVPMTPVRWATAFLVVLVVGFTGKDFIADCHRFELRYLPG